MSSSPSAYAAKRATVSSGNRSTAGLIAPAGVALLALLAAGAAPVLAEHTESHTLDGNSLYVGNLIGTIQVEGGGSSFEVEVTVRGDDAERLAPQIRVREGSRASLEIEFPVQRERRFVYPELGGGQTSIQVHQKRDRDQGWLRELIDALSGDRIRVSGSGSGAEVWADVRIKVPKGATLELQHGVGKVNASDVDGDLSLDILSGGVSADAVRGSLVVSTGSGGVVVNEIEGELSIDTGSGGVKVSQVEGPKVTIDTGSGGVILQHVKTRHLAIDTGSGGVEASEVGADSASIDTGSGSVVLALQDMGTGAFEIDTGSGSITLLVPSYASAEVDADTGSGGIQVDLPQFDTLHKDRDEMRFRVGRGDARVKLDTGSGRIRVGPVEG